MPRDFTPVEQRPTRNLELRFDRLTSNSLVADAIEAFQIMHELARRQMIAQRQAPANEGTNVQQQHLAVVPDSARPGEQTEEGGPDGAAG